MLFFIYRHKSGALPIYIISSYFDYYTSLKLQIEFFFMFVYFTHLSQWNVIYFAVKNQLFSDQQKCEIQANYPERVVYSVFLFDTDRRKQHMSFTYIYALFVLFFEIRHVEAEMNSE